jgi:hypothetical protein
MECKRLEDYLRKNECTGISLGTELRNHIEECRDCKSYFLLVGLLNSQKGAVEKAPQSILLNVQHRIRSLQRPSEKPAWLNTFKLVLKPALAFSILLAAVFLYTNFKNNYIGVVDNLVDRFNISKFKYIKTGDVLYTGDSTTATIRLNGNNILQIHQNTVVVVKGPRHISLSHGEISLLSGDRELQIETPDGLLLARNADTRIRTTTTKPENGLSKTETTCIVLNGKLVIKYPLKEIILSQGQEAVVAENGGITCQKQLTPAESASEKSPAINQKLFAAVQSLCDCIYAFNYTPDKKANHLELFGKEVNENNFKVRVFWQEKKLNKPVLGPSGEINKICFMEKRRSDG